METKTDASFAHELQTLEHLYTACRVGLGLGSSSAGATRASDVGSVKGGGLRSHGCARARTDCTSMSNLSSTDATCHFNVYLRRIISVHNALPPQCAGLPGGAGWDGGASECAAREFDAQYDFETYSVRGDCSVHIVRHLQLLGDDVWCSAANVEPLRTVVEESITVETDASRMVLSNVANARGQALVNILQVVFIILLMGVSSYLFQQDAEKLVIGPLTRMAKVVAALSENPLAKIEEGGEGDPKFETDFVERAIKKFGKLLQIAFGEAGSEIIGKKKDGTQKKAKGGEINPMVAGRKIQAIFGFAILNHFNDCTDALQEDVMLYVNIVADIVHRAVKDNAGAPNKNIGDAFLVAWKLPEGPSPLSCPQPSPQTDMLPNPLVTTHTARGRWGPAMLACAHADVCCALVAHLRDRRRVRRSDRNANGKFVR